MKHERRLAPLAVVAGLALASLSATAWHDGPAGAPAPETYSTSQSSSDVSFVPTRFTHHRSRNTSDHRHPVRLASGVPLRLDVPSIGVSASVSSIGTGSSLILTPPSDYTTVGWWSQGAKPGDGSGTTIIAGHTVHTGGGALDNLGDVAVGDQVILERRHQDLGYHVESVTTYRKGTLASEAASVFDQTGPERLAIVTCSDYNGEIYLSNTVVIATHPRPVASR